MKNPKERGKSHKMLLGVGIYELVYFGDYNGSTTN